jgi:TolA-binding protein
MALFSVRTENTMKNRDAASRLFAACLATSMLVSPTLGLQSALGQQSTPAKSPQTKPAVQPKAKPKESGVAQLSDKEKRQEKAREIFADAANAQNNGAFPLAVEQWTKLLKEYPSDPLASSARHFLGVCYLQQEKADFPAAIEQFKLSLQDTELKQREESLVTSISKGCLQKEMLASNP